MCAGPKERCAATGTGPTLLQVEGAVLCAHSGLPGVFQEGVHQVLRDGFIYFQGKRAVESSCCKPSLCVVVDAEKSRVEMYC